MGRSGAGVLRGGDGRCVLRPQGVGGWSAHGGECWAWFGRVGDGRLAGEYSGVLSAGGASGVVWGGSVGRYGIGLVGSFVGGTGGGILCGRRRGTGSGVGLEREWVGGVWMVEGGGVGLWGGGGVWWGVWPGGWGVRGFWGGRVGGEGGGGGGVLGPAAMFGAVCQRVRDADGVLGGFATPSAM